ncbi:MAG TPA: hypothetical protein VKO63_07385, partial [Chitinispirillaceae bacterium]|nr:hypothetical protein [Chitinispirillaceae bacterium]
KPNWIAEYINFFATNMTISINRNGSLQDDGVIVLQTKNTSFRRERLRGTERWLERSIVTITSKYIVSNI